MSDYTITTNFQEKDGLPSGNAAKTIRGTDFSVEFTNIATAVGTKVNRTGDTFSGAVTFASTATFSDAVDINTTKVKLDGSDGELALGTNTFYTFDGNSANSVLSINQANGEGAMPAIHVTSVADSTFNYSSVLAATSGTNGFEILMGADQFKLGATRGIRLTTGSSNQNLSPVVDGIGGPFTNNNDAVDLGTGTSRFKAIYLTTSPNVGSDRKLKENIEDADDAGSVLDNIRIRKFDWISNGTHQSYGVVAQELAEVFPEATSEPENEEDIMGVTYERLIPMLVKEIQSLRSRVAELENV
ncbi:tail fiber domain-containing protein [bacterium]|nr:tail fiber domain-containing protein [bacterium]